MSSFWKIFISVILTIAVVGGGTFYIMQRQIDSIRDDNQKKLEDLNKQIKDLKPVSTTSTSTPSADTTASSETYTNKSFGFSFKLPSGYSVLEETMFEGAQGVVLRFGKDSSTDVSEFNFVKLQYAKDTRTLSAMETEFTKEGGSDLTDRKDLTVGGQKAISYLVGGLASGKTVLTANGTATVELSVYPDNDSTKAFLDSIASSFQFTK